MMNSETKTRAVILAAGVARRLYPMTREHPKCLVRVGERSILEHQLTALERAGVRDVTLVVGYRREEIMEAAELTFPEMRFTEVINHHFFETNKALDIDRAAAFGMHLDVPAGTAVRFEPGESKQVALTEFGGTGELFGLNNLTDGASRSAVRKDAALRRARERGFKGA